MNSQFTDEVLDRMSRSGSGMKAVQQMRSLLVGDEKKAFERRLTQVIAKSPDSRVARLYSGNIGGELVYLTEFYLDAAGSSGSSENRSRWLLNMLQGSPSRERREVVSILLQKPDAYNRVLDQAFLLSEELNDLPLSMLRPQRGERLPDEVLSHMYRKGHYKNAVVKRELFGILGKREQDFVDASVRVRVKEVGLCQ